MLRASTLRRALPRSVAHGYAAPFLSRTPRSSAQRSAQWRRAVSGNSDVAAFFAPDAERYVAWYKATYNVDDISDGSAAAHACTPRHDAAAQTATATDELDTAAVTAELQYWYDEFCYRNLSQ